MSLKTGEALLRYPMAGALDGGGRVLARFLLALADVYQITGDDRCRKRFMAQVAHNFALLKQQPNKADQSIFGRRTKRLRPYQGWYGATALIKMYRLTGDQRLMPHIRREVAESMKMDLYRRDLVELWPGVPPEEGRPIMCADFARHRGALMFPVLMQYAKLTGERQWADLALRALYAGAVEGIMVQGAQELLALAALAACPPDVSEARLVREAQDLLWNAASPGIANGGLAKSATHWVHYRPVSFKSLSYHDNFAARRKSTLRLDTQVYKGNPPSLRFELTPKRRRIIIDAARFRIGAGLSRYRAWVRVGEAVDRVSFKFSVSSLDGVKPRWMAFWVERGVVKTPVRNATDLKVVSCAAAPPDPAGWRKVEFVFRAPKRCVARPYLGAKLKPKAQAGHVWFDGIELKRTGT